jgi:hypothetical protein
VNAACEFRRAIMSHNSSSRRFYARIRRATDTRAIGELMKQAFEGRQDRSIEGRCAKSSQ